MRECLEALQALSFGDERVVIQTKLVQGLVGVVAKAAALENSVHLSCQLVACCRIDEIPQQQKAIFQEAISQRSGIVAKSGRVI